MTQEVYVVIGADIVPTGDELCSDEFNPDTIALFDCKSTAKLYVEHLEDGVISDLNPKGYCCDYATIKVQKINFNSSIS